MLFNYDTVWPALAWTLYELARNPSAAEGIKVELKADASNVRVDDAHAKTSKVEQVSASLRELHGGNIIMCCILRCGYFYMPCGLGIDPLAGL